MGRGWRACRGAGKDAGASLRVLGQRSDTSPKMSFRRFFRPQRVHSFGLLHAGFLWFVHAGETQNTPCRGSVRNYIPDPALDHFSESREHFKIFYLQTLPRGFAKIFTSHPLDPILSKSGRNLSTVQYLNTNGRF